MSNPERLGQKGGRARGVLTPTEDSEVTALLREFDRVVVQLWQLGIDTSLRVTATLRNAELDGIQRGDPLPDEDAIVRLTPQQLDAFAAECALSAATVFALHNWTWSTSWGDENETFVPGATALMKSIRQKLDEVPLDHSLSSGRVGVSRFIEDGAERVSAWLDLGSAAGDDDA